MEFSERLKQIRNEKGLTQQQVADCLGITKGAYSGYETGRRKPDVAKIKGIASVLDVSGDYLLDTGFDRKEESPDQTAQGSNNDLLNVFSKFPPERKEFYLRLIEFLMEEEKKALNN